MLRITLAAVAAAITLWCGLRPTNLTSAGISDLVAEAPLAEEIHLLDEVAAWSGDHPLGTSTVSSTRGRSPGSLTSVPFPGEESLANAVLTRAESFEQFVSLTSSDQAALQGVPFADLIGPIARRHGVDPLLVAAVIEAESSFDPHAVSPVGAIGLMQVMPVTASDLGSSDPAEISVPRKNVDIGTRYLARLLRRFEGNVALAVAAYNAGPGAVSRFGGLPPYAETQHYVERVLSRYVSSLRAALPADERTSLAQLMLDRG